MKGNITFSMIKPDAYKAGNIGSIIKMIESNGFKLQAAKLIKLSAKGAERFYDIHKERPFFKDLVSYIISDPVFAMVLEKDNAVESFRKLIGSTDPKQAAAGTIRNLFATNIEANAIHGSDSDENARIESQFFFSKLEYCG